MNLPSSMFRPRRIILSAALLFAGCLPLAQAQSIPSSDDESAESDRAWKEIALNLPAPPQDADLLPFYVSPLASMRFTLDSKSISIGKDGAVRYTLVIISSSGVRNISYEGIRCENRTRRVYAFGQANGSWSRARRDAWEPVQMNNMNRYQAALAHEYLCVDAMLAGTPAQIVRRIKEIGGVGADRPAFTTVGPELRN